MCQPASRTFVRWAFVAALAGVAGVGSSLVAQVTCYKTKCLVYPDGSRLCERTPVDCSTIRM